MGLLSFLRPQKPGTESQRRERLLRSGRITEGRILDTDGENLEEATQIFYVYSVNGADYESSQPLTEEQLRRPADYAPGAKISVRYDPRQPGNSIVV
jgi:hypothetical protein